MCRYGLDLNSAAKGEMQIATRQGNGADLNIWVTSINFFGVIGWVCNPEPTTARHPTSIAPRHMCAGRSALTGAAPRSA